MSNQKLVDCPACGWSHFAPELDESGLPYTCYVCCNSGQVSADVAANYNTPPSAGEYADRETQHGRYIDCGPNHWDDC